MPSGLVRLASFIGIAAGMIVGCRDHPPPALAASPPVRVATAIPLIGARVRVIVPDLGPGWRTGMFQRTRQDPPCYVVLIFNPGHDMTVSATVYANSIARMQMSTLYRGDSVADRDPAAAAYEGESWNDVPLDSAKHSGRFCPARVDRTH